MACLLVAKRSVPHVVPDVPASRWQLGDEGQRRCPALAQRLAPYQPAVIVASVEPKAAQTADLVAAHLGLRSTTCADLHEHDRSTTGFLRGQEFRAAVARFFAQPDDLVFGHETAAQAQARFVTAVHRVVIDHPGQTVVVVAHGTVIALFAARHAGIDPFPLWQQLDLPSFLVFALPGYALIEVIPTLSGV